MGFTFHTYITSWNSALTYAIPFLLIISMPMSATPPSPRRRLRWSALLPLLFLLTLVGAVAATLVARQQLLPTQPAEQQLAEQQVAVERGDLLESVTVNGTLAPP